MREDSEKADSGSFLAKQSLAMLDLWQSHFRDLINADIVNARFDRETKWKIALFSY